VAPFVCSSNPIRQDPNRGVRNPTSPNKIQKTTGKRGGGTVREAIYKSITSDINRRKAFGGGPPTNPLNLWKPEKTIKKIKTGWFWVGSNLLIQKKPPTEPQNDKLGSRRNPKQSPPFVGGMFSPPRKKTGFD